MAMVPHQDNYQVCWYHAMACYFAVEDGLCRDPTQQQVYQKVFPKLNAIQNSAASRKLTGTIRKFIPAGVSDEVRKSFSAKSMRKAAINCMAAHPSIGYYESHVHSGHAKASSQEHYIDRESLVLSITAAKALNEYGDCSSLGTSYSPPNFSWLPSQYEEQLERFISELYNFEIG